MNKIKNIDIFSLDQQKNYIIGAGIFNFIINLHNKIIKIKKNNYIILFFYQKSCFK